MGFIATIQQYFFRRHLERELLSRQANYAPQAVHPLEAKCVALLFIADDADDRKAVEAYQQARKKAGLRTEILGFFSVEVNQAAYSFDQFSKHDLNWYGIPKGANVEKFLERPCDLLITLGRTAQAQLDYLAALKQTKLRVGPHTGLNDNPYDVQFFIPISGMSVAAQFRQIDQIFKVTNAPKVSFAV